MRGNREIVQRLRWARGEVCEREEERRRRKEKEGEGMGEGDCVRQLEDCADEKRKQGMLNE